MNLIYMRVYHKLSRISAACECFGCRTNSDKPHRIRSFCANKILKSK